MSDPAATPPTVVNIHELAEREHSVGQFGAAFMSLTPSMAPRGGKLGINRMRLKKGHTTCPLHYHLREDEALRSFSLTSEAAQATPSSARLVPQAEGTGSSSGARVLPRAELRAGRSRPLRSKRRALRARRPRLRHRRSALRWGNPCLDYTVQMAGSPLAGIDAATFQHDAEVAFAAWEAAHCPGGGTPRFHARFQGFVGCQRLEAVCGGPEKNDNVLMFHDQGWPHASNVIGLTTPSGGQDSGLVVDTDLELNSQDFDFKAGASGSGTVKLPDVLAHEIGHFLGLTHRTPKAR